MTELLLIRHGQTDWNREKKVMGRQPISLNSVGREQVLKLQGYLNAVKIDAFYSSPVKRTWETSEIICKDRDLEICAADELAEIDYGEWENMTFSEIHRDKKDAWHTYKTNPEELSIPGGESMPEVKARVGSLLNKILEKHTGERVALVSHADVLKVALVHIFEFPLYFLRQCSVENASLLWVRYDAEFGPRLNFYNGLNNFGSDL